MSAPPNDLALHLPGQIMARPLITTPPRRNQANPAHTAEAVRAISLTRREGRVWDAYAGCDRSPFGWENSRG